jgi:hypothetical protein
MDAAPAVDRASAAQITSGAAGEGFTVPRQLRILWPFLIALVAVEAAHEVLGLPGPTDLYDSWIPSFVIVAAAALCLGRAALVRSERGAWLSFGLGMLCWSVGTVLWSVLYGGESQPPFPSPADAFWLLWYPFIALGIAFLIRGRVSHFELHRWMDGLAVMLLVLAAAFPFTLQSVDGYLHKNQFAAIVDVGYPVLDTLLLGAILGIFGLMAWRPGKVWLMLGLGCLIMAVADVAFAVQQSRGFASYSHYDFLWTVGALLIAYAAWLAPIDSPDHGELVGLQAIALPLAAQLFAVALQACIILFPSFDTESHRIVVLAVLIIATFQIVLARPRLSGEQRN